MNYIPVIGLEIHIELATKSKMFCECPANHFGKKANTATCPVCLGLPGALPFPNKQAIEWTHMLGAAVDCELASVSKFDRKHYFYPDLPKGYQISQYDQPLCVNGKLTINQQDGSKKTIGITRVHLEEDTGKLKHAKVGNKLVSMVDFNRSGVPLVEIVTKPNITSAEEAVEFAQNLRQIARFLSISECDMDKGSMRLEANVSVAKMDSQLLKPKKLPNYKIELKNINSFKFMQRAIDIEVKRQTVILQSSGLLFQETRGYNEDKDETFAQRSKEEAKDYRYFPEPDIPPLVFDEKYLAKVRNNLPESPESWKARITSKYSIPDHYLDIFMTDPAKAKEFEKVLIKASNLMDDVKQIVNEIVNNGLDVRKLDVKKLVADLKSKQKSIITDVDIIRKWVLKAVSELEKPLLDYRAGKKEVLGVFIGKVMQYSNGQADVKIIKNILTQELDKS